MKTTRILVCLTSVTLATSAFAQTNTFPNSGNVGIGTTAPATPLDVRGPSAVADAPGTYPAGVRMAVNVTSTGNGDAGGTSDVRGVNSVVTTTGTANISADAVYGNLKLNGSGAGVASGTAGLFIAEQTGSGTVGGLYGLHARVNTTGSGNVTTAQAIQAYLIQTGTGNVTTWRAFNHPGITASSTGDVIGPIYIYGASGWGRATATTAYCYNAEDATKGSGTLAAFRGNVSVATGKYNLYMEGAAQNYIAGNVGIGTTSPVTKLDVVGQGQFSVDGAGADTSSYGVLGVTRAASANTLSYIAMTRSANAVKAMGIDASNRWVFGVPAPGTQIIGSPQMVIEVGGNVGIGTSSPTQKLSVNGTVRAKEVIVDTGWSDYVFDESYRLAPLSEVERQIKAEKHLPGIPSAAEVAEHGVSMGEMQSKLLAKVEELTLHLIEQEKDIAKLKETNAAQQIRYATEAAVLREQISKIQATRTTNQP